MGVKEELARFYYSLTHFNAKMLRTLKDLLLDPGPVVESNDGYVSAPRFALTVLSGLFALMLYLDPPGAEGMSKEILLFYPNRVQQYFELQSTLAANYSVILVAVLFVPIYFLLNTILFWGKKSWIFFYRASLYQIALILFFFALMNGIIVKQLDLPDFFKQLTLILALIFIGYHYFRFNLGRWYLSALKGMLVILGCLSLALSHGHYIVKMIENVKAPQQTHYKMADSSHLLTRDVGIDANILTQASLDDNVSQFGPLKAIVVGEETITRVDSNTIRWSKKQNPQVDSYGTIPENKIIGGVGLNEETNTVVKEILDYDGEQQYQQSFNLNYDVATYELIETSDSSFTFGVFGKTQSITLIDFKNKKGKWSSSSVTQRLESGKVPTGIKQLPTSGSYVATYEDESEGRVIQKSVALLDDNFNLVWNQQIYDKTTQYRPNSYTHYKIDESKGKLFTFYTIANDTCMEARIHAININNGDMIWESTTPIPSGFFIPYDVDLGPDNLIVSGEARKYFSRYFWEPSYYISMIFALDRQDGSMAGHKFFGPTSNQSISEVKSTWLENSTLHFITADDPAESYPYGMFEDERNLSFKSVEIDSIME